MRQVDPAHLIGTLRSTFVWQHFIRWQDALGLRQKQAAAFRNQEIGFIFQFHHLMPEFTALENVMMPGLIARRPKTEMVARAEALWRAWAFATA